MQLATLDVEAILSHGKELLGSAGKQYDFKLAGLNASERLAHQKRTLTARLGLGGEYIEEDLVTEKDIAIRSSSFSTPALPTLDTDVSKMSGLSPKDDALMGSPDDVSVQTPAGGEMSKRQLNMLKTPPEGRAQTRQQEIQVRLCAASQQLKHLSDAIGTRGETADQGRASRKWNGRLLLTRAERWR